MSWGFAVAVLKKYLKFDVWNIWIEFIFKFGVVILRGTTSLTAWKKGDFCEFKKKKYHMFWNFADIFVHKY